MKKYCHYCNSLHKAFEDQNYCSNQGDSIASVSTNAYYFKSNDLNSGNHVSRLSVRTISDGYQFHQVQGSDFMLDKDKYLIINEGEEFHSEISTNMPLEGLLVAFERKDIRDFSDNINLSHDQLLEYPEGYDSSELNFETQSIDMDVELKGLFIKLKNNIASQEADILGYEETFSHILCHLYKDQKSIYRRVEGLDSKKSSTRKEIFRRLRTARDYMDVSLESQVNLDQLSRKAMMSKFHFLRCFKDFYGISPHQYLMSKRIEMAKFLLKDTDFTVDNIASKVGFENKCSFGRLFKRQVRMTPITYRKHITSQKMFFVSA